MELHQTAKFWTRLPQEAVMENLSTAQEVSTFGTEGECDPWTISRLCSLLTGSEGPLVSSCKCITCIAGGWMGVCQLKFCGGQFFQASLGNTHISSNIFH